MPKQRPPFDTQRYESLKAQGLSQRAIAQEMGMPEATLRNNLKVMAQVVAQELGEGLSMGDQDIPHGESSDVDPGPPVGDHRGTPVGDNGTPPLYVHPGIPDDAQESPISDKDIAGVHQGIPILPLTGLQEGDQGGPGSPLSPELAEALTAGWPELVQMLDWWRARQQYTQEPTERLERVTWHVAPRWIEAVRREADQTRQTYAAIVNTALAIYFRGKST